MGEVLQQHTSRWTTARVMLNKLKELASPSIYVAGQAFLKGLQNQDAPTMANLLLQIIISLPEEIGLKITNIRSLVGEVKSSFGVVVPAYCWDEGQKTFKQILGREGPVAGSCMSVVLRYILYTNPKLPIMAQLPELEQNRINHNSSGPDLNCLQD
jgi:hypothetical protein